MSGRWSWLTSRFVLVPAVMAAAIGLWNLYVGAHNGGIIEGAVVDPAGRPVVGAEVVVLRQNVTTFSEAARATTDPQGRFRFDDNRWHHVQLFAEKDGIRSERTTLRLWFKAQDASLAEPLRLPVDGPRS